MSPSTTLTKIQTLFANTIASKYEDWLDLLKSGCLRQVELELFDSMNESYDLICTELLSFSASECTNDLIREAKLSGGRKIVQRPVSIRLATGTQIKVKSSYVKKPSSDWIGSRHLLMNHWKIIDGNSPLLNDRVGYCTSLGPSYEMACQTLKKFGVQVSVSSVREITNRLALKCFELGEENLILKQGESLANKTVVISLDGGRTRTREYTEQYNTNKKQKYLTPWCEPKLFVIDVLDKNGEVARHELPVYGCRFSDVDVFILLKRFLVKLQINQASRVQILADGAPWIWNNMKPMLLKLGVEEDRITETLDYYHAFQYVHQIVSEMPKRIGKKKKAAYLKLFKNCLWNGKVRTIVNHCKLIFKKPGKLIKRWINYLDKHESKTQYVHYETNNLLCGSGIIESGIRRIINLRFKNASTFWIKQNVEKLYLLRSALLSKRWDILMANLVK